MNAAATTALVEKLKQGDEAAYHAMMQQWQKRVFNFALRYANDRYFAHEVVQNTFIQAFEKIHQLKDPAKLRSWLYRIASNNCSTEGRKRARRQVTEVNEQILSHADPNNPVVMVEKQELKQLVMDLLQQIPDEQREVIIMKEYEGLKFREISEALGLSENTVKSRMYYGLDAMRKLMEQQNLTKDIYYES